MGVAEDVSLNRFAILSDHPRLMVRCAQPDALGWDTLKRLGVTMVYKLNDESEAKFGDEAARGFQVQADPPSQQHPTEKWLRSAVKQVGDMMEAGSLAIHCTHGRDRTGFLCAGYRVLTQGWSVDRALDEFYSFGVTGFIRLWDHKMEEVIRGLGR